MNAPPPISAPRSPDCDVLVVGAGPAGLACAIRLLSRDPSLHVWVLEKAAAPGAHLLSGAVIAPAPLRALLSTDDFSALPLFPPVARQRFAYLTLKRALYLPFAPPPMSMRGQPLADAALLGKKLADIATRLGAEICCSQPAVALDLSPCPASPPVVLTGDPRTPEPVVASRAVVLAEGPAGTLAAAAAQKFPTLAPPSPQSCSLGIKRVYSLPPDALPAFPPSS
ncbi:MAG: NAD(P)-binding protein, partial [Kiritimatiellae bacterium]|nr:NAD(P)-binding protein [Kiritimatiellia bacterium]